MSLLCLEKCVTSKGSSSSSARALCSSWVHSQRVLPEFVFGCSALGTALYEDSALTLPCRLLGCWFLLLEKIFGCRGVWCSERPRQVRHRQGKERVGSTGSCESRASRCCCVRAASLPSPASPLPPGEFMTEFTAILYLAEILKNAFAVNGFL